MPHSGAHLLTDSGAGGSLMNFSEALRTAERNLTQGATLTELRELAHDLRALTPDSLLADLVEIRIQVIEGRWDGK